MAKPVSVDDYIAGFPPEIQSVLQSIRATVREAAPKSTERIAYQMPALYQEGFVVSYAAYKHHIGIYPVAEGDMAFNKALAPYVTHKRTVRIPLDKPPPLGLIRKLVQLRVKINLANAKAAKQK
jgi:uncharacterized protein YdhG (YjbR/CyaY superfamily)